MNYFNLIPPDYSTAPPRRFFPGDKPHRLSVALLWLVFLVYLAYWARMHWGWLFDPLMQSDDARIWLFPFHRYTPGNPLAADPVAMEKLALTPSGVRLLYRFLVPWAGLYISPKIVQGLCLGIFGFAAWALARARKGGLAAGILLAFLALNTRFIVNSMAGGLARAFSFPLSALWVAGVFTGRERLRWAAIMLSALTYPMSMVLLLGAEMVTALWNNLRRNGKVFRLRLLRAILLACVSALIILPYLAATRKTGRSFTLREAVQEPAFYPGGRLYELPFPGIPQARQALAPYPAYVILPAAFAALALFLLLARYALPVEALALLAVSGVMYWLSRVFAFRLFMPERFLDYAAPLLFIMASLTLLRRIGARARGRKRTVLRNLSVCCFIAAFVFIFPKAIRRENGMTIEGRSHSRLYAFLRTLPPGIRIACHPDDGSDIPFWAGRSTLVNRENLLPFTVEFWAFQKTRAFDTLSALYAVSGKDVLSFSSKYGITHFLLNEGRYGPGFREAAKVFEPFGSYVKGVVAPLKKRDLALADVPPEAVVFRDPPFILVDVKLLERSWETKRSL